MISPIRAEMENNNPRSCHQTYPYWERAPIWWFYSYLWRNAHLLTLQWAAIISPLVIPDSISASCFQESHYSCCLCPSSETIDPASLPPLSQTALSLMRLTPLSLDKWIQRRCNVTKANSRCFELKKKIQIKKKPKQSTGPWRLFT